MLFTTSLTSYWPFWILNKYIHAWTRSKFWGTSFLNHWQLFQPNDKKILNHSIYFSYGRSCLLDFKMISSHGFGLYIVPLSVRKFHLLSTLATSNFLYTSYHIPLVKHFPPWSILNQPCLFYSSCYSHQTGLKVRTASDHILFWKISCENISDTVWIFFSLVQESGYWWKNSHRNPKTTFSMWVYKCIAWCCYCFASSSQLADTVILDVDGRRTVWGAMTWVRRRRMEQ